MSQSTGSGPAAGNMLLGYALLGLQPLPVAMLARGDVGPAETVFARFLLSALLILAVCAIRWRGLSTAQPRLLLLRGLLGGGAVLLYFSSIQWAGAARGTLLNYTYPIWANLFAWMLGHRPSGRFWWALSLALVGIWFVVVPEQGLGDGTIGRGEWAGLASAVLAGGAVLTIKRLRETDESLTIIASFTSFGLLMSLPLSSIEVMSRLISPELLVPGLSVGLLAFVGHVFFTRGYRGVSVQTATLLSPTVPLIATLTGIVMLDEVVTGRFGLGALAILASSMLALRAHRNKGSPTPQQAS
jgi:drug/metabolite transporter (DMT)-like permease